MNLLCIQARDQVPTLKTESVRTHYLVRAPAHFPGWRWMSER